MTITAALRQLRPAHCFPLYDDTQVACTVYDVHIGRGSTADPMVKEFTQLGFNT